METKSEKLEMLKELTNSDISELGYNWIMPTPLQNITNLPTFPIETLPKIIKDYVLAVADNIQIPVDMAAVSALSVIAGTIQKKYVIEGKEDYTEPLNIYGVIVAKSAERKSATMRKMTSPIYHYEKEENKRRQLIIDQQTIELNSKHNQIKKLENSKKDEDLDKAIMLQIECRELEEKQIKPLRLIAEDCTSEALTSLLADNQGRISLISAEGGGLFNIFAGKYSNNNVSIETILKAHNGDPIRIDRKGRETEYVNNPTISMLLAIQENVLEGLMLNEVFRDRGLNARILYCKPKSTIGTRTLTTKTMFSELSTAELNYKELIYKLLDIPLEENPKILKLSKKAYKILETFFSWVELQLVGELEFMGDWAGKLVGTTLRIAGILHLMDYSNIEKNTVVSDKTLQNAITIAKYFLEHAKSAYLLMGADKGIQKAKYILKQIEKQVQTQFKRHEIFKMCRSANIHNVQDIEQPLSILTEYGYIRELPIIQREGAGRKPDIVYELNPLYFNDIK